MLKVLLWRAVSSLQYQHQCTFVYCIVQYLPNYCSFCMSVRAFITVCFCLPYCHYIFLVYFSSFMKAKLLQLTFLSLACSLDHKTHHINALCVFLMSENHMENSSTYNTTNPSSSNQSDGINFVMTSLSQKFPLIIKAYLLVNDNCSLL